MLIGIKEKKVSSITLPGGHNIKEFSENFDIRGTTTFSVGNLFVKELRAGYPYSHLHSAFQVSDFQSVVRFINRNKFLYDVLREIEAAIRKYFPCEILRLDIYGDPEGEMKDELAIFILTSDEPHIALDKLDKFDSEYWIEKVDQYEKFVTVNVEYLRKD